MRRILNILTKNRVLIGVLLIGVFLRFYKLTGFVTFLGDQGRDAIIVKRILTGEHFPAIGPPTSVGQVYLGPFYYYFIAPWLLLSNFNPIGLAVGVAFFSSLYLFINYLIVKELFDKKIALISTILLSFSSVLIDFSRFSWNPNLLPLFTLLTVYFVIKSLKTNKWYYFALSGTFLSFSIQLHYLALFLIPPIGILLMATFIKKIKQSNNETMKQLKNYLLMFFSFFLFSMPLIIFDLRHNFLNSKLFLALFKSSGTSFLTKINSFFDSFYYLNLYSFNIDLNRFFVYLLLLFLLLAFVTLIKRSSNLKTFLLFFLLTMLGMSFYNGPKYPHYFGVLYPLYYVIISYFLVFHKQSVWQKYLTIFFVIGFIFLNFQKYPYFRDPPNNQIVLAKNVAQKISDNIKKEKFTVTALPEKYSDSTYRYFLEIWGKRAIEKDSLKKADELFVVCEKKCDILIGNPMWDIAYFA
ncbi:MAG TPA: glycosyltransferase family 39 protein, partial [Patescibacteria group bacterium]